MVLVRMRVFVGMLVRVFTGDRVIVRVPVLAVVGVRMGVRMGVRVRRTRPSVCVPHVVYVFVCCRRRRACAHDL